MSFDRIPAELRNRPQWVVWRYEEREGKRTKVPYRSDGEGRASSTDPETWSTFEAAVAGVESLPAAGVGFVFSVDDPYVGVDLDDGLSEADRAAIMSALDSYTETSVSGNGAHVIVRAALNGSRNRRGPFEVYDQGRYFVVTGDHVRGTPTTVEDRQAELDEVLEHFLPKNLRTAVQRLPAQPVDLEDDALLDRAFRAKNSDAFTRLWGGETSAYGDDHSAADLALLAHLAFWTGRDAGRMDRMFRSSGLYRDKWERDDYRERTIDAAIAGCRDVYEPKGRPVADDPPPKSEEGSAATVISLSSLISRPSSSWPEPLEDVAYNGLLGRIARTIEPHSEADPVAVLAQLVVGFGNAVGHSPYVAVEADRHYANLFCVLVGDTAKARKGTSWGQARSVLTSADPGWEERIVSGLSSGEGLIAQVADSEESEPGEVSPPKDHRLLVVESELVSTFKVATRDGSTLSPVIRAAWDSGTLRTLTRHSPLKATGAHVSIIGHITSEELRRYLDATETANGFANRFLWLCVRRSKLLPEGGAVPVKELQGLAGKLRDAILASRRRTRVDRDDEARAVWAEAYGELSEGQAGLVGALLARAEAQVLRVAMLYALADNAPAIQAHHLHAALAWQRYAADSVRYLFGDSTGNPDADAIAHALADAADGLTRTQISGLFGRHASAARIDRALRLLADRGLATAETEQTGGRPVQRWRGTP